MELKYAFCGFLDILGYGAMVESDARVPRSPRFLPGLSEALAEARSRISPPDVLTLKAFSDSIIVAGELQPQHVARLFECVRELQLALLMRGILVRGGISFGYHFMTEDLVFSHALVDAYRLESQHATYPRVIVSKDLVNLYQDQFEDSSVKPFLRCERDGWAFIHYLAQAEPSSTWGAIRSIVDLGAPNSSAQRKQQWLIEYFGHTFPAFDRGDTSRFLEFSASMCI